MNETVLADRAQFAFTIMFHYLFPILTMGIGPLIALLKSLHYFRGGEIYASAARFWARIFAINFGMGVVTGIPMEFQFGANWSQFSSYAGGVVGQTLAMEGVYAFFLESAFLGILLLGERRVPKFVHWLSSIMVAFGALLSGFFIVATDAWMQHPVGYIATRDGRVVISSIWAQLTNPFLGWQYWHTINGALLTGAMVMAGIGAFYLLSSRDQAYGRLFVKIGVIAGLAFSVIQVFPTGDRAGANVSHYQPVKLAAMEGVFHTNYEAPLAIIGMPDTVRGNLLDPVEVPDVLSFLAYGNVHAKVTGLDDVPRTLWPPVAATYYAYHIMVGLGTAFLGLMGLGLLLMPRSRIYAARWYLWLLMIAMPFPYIANEAGWAVSEIGRQPWLIYGLMRTSAGYSQNVNAGETVFTLLGFAGLYALLGLVFLYLLLRIIAGGPATVDSNGQVTGSTEGAA